MNAYALGTHLALKTAGLLWTTPQERRQNQAKGNLLGTAAMMGTGLGAAGLFAGGHALEQVLTPEAAREGLTEGLRKHMKVPADIKVDEWADSFLQSHFNPETRSVSVSGPKPSPGILAHELGHASGRPPLGTDVPIASKMIGMGSIPVSMITQMLTKPGSTASNIAMYAPSALMAPMLLEELRASTRGLRGLYRAGGKGAMLRGLLPLLPALGTYVAGAATPVIWGKVYQHYANK